MYSSDFSLLNQFKEDNDHSKNISLLKNRSMRNSSKYNSMENTKDDMKKIIDFLWINVREKINSDLTATIIDPFIGEKFKQEIFKLEKSFCESARCNKSEIQLVLETWRKENNIDILIQNLNVLSSEIQQRIENEKKLKFLLARSKSSINEKGHNIFKLIEQVLLEEEISEDILFDNLTRKNKMT